MTPALGRNPGKKAGRTIGVNAFTLIDLLVGIVLLAALAAIVLPRFGRAKVHGPRFNCTNNLKQTGLSFRVWALDNQDRFPMQVPISEGGTKEFVNFGTAWVHFRVLSNELNTPKVLFCSSEQRNGRIAANTFGSSSSPSSIPFTNDCNVSYFVGVDASTNYPNMFLVGDGNLTNSIKPSRRMVSFATNQPSGWTEELHEFQGNVGLADGSVRQFNDVTVRSALIATGVATNRLAMP